MALALFAVRIGSRWRLTISSAMPTGASSLPRISGHCASGAISRGGPAREAGAAPPGGEVARVRSTEGGAMLAQGRRSGAGCPDRSPRSGGTLARRWRGSLHSHERFPMYSPGALAAVAGVCKPEADGTHSMQPRGSVAVCTALAPREPHRLARKSFAEGDTITLRTGGTIGGRVALAGALP